MNLITKTPVTTVAIATPANTDIHHPEGYWHLEESKDTLLDSFCQLTLGPIKCPPRANFHWESHTGITGGTIRVQKATVINDRDYEGPVLIVEGYLIQARLATPHELFCPPNFNTANVYGVDASWGDFLYSGSCTVHDEAITQQLLDHIHQIIGLQGRIDVLKASFGR